MNKDRGFTLIEMLVVIFIIALLASVIVVTVSRARVDSRDAKRRADLEAIKSAVEMYYDREGTYVIKQKTGEGTGNGGGSWGWFNCTGGVYTISIATGLESWGFLNPSPSDPNYSRTSCLTGSYMYWANSRLFSIYAHLENMTDANADGWDDSSSIGTYEVPRTNYTMNLRVGNGF